MSFTDSKIRQSDSCFKQALKYKASGQYDLALKNFRESAEILVSLLKSHVPSDLKQKLQNKANDAICEGMLVKKKLGDQDKELNKNIKKSIGPITYISTEFILTKECADFYGKLGNSFYNEAAGRDTGKPQKQMLQSAIAAHICQAEILKRVSLR